MIGAKVIMDSVSPSCPRLTMLQITMHRFVLAEFNTHRVFSRNFRSSRAVPVHKLLAEVRIFPAEPVSWRANKPGMQGGLELEASSLDIVKGEWRRAAIEAADRAEAMSTAGLHKSWANRVLEPFLFVHGVVTATEWDNFFELRRHPDAQPEMRLLAEAMYGAMRSSTPKTVAPGDFHLPYVSAEEIALAGSLIPVKLSVARCARVSYLTQDGKKPSIDDDLKLYDRLVGSVPLHASPAEHQATPDPRRTSPQFHGNFRGWVQYRKTLEMDSSDARN